MTDPLDTNCTYCGTNHPKTADTCQVCGAPLGGRAPAIAPRVPRTVRPRAKQPLSSSSQSLEDLKEVGAAADRVVRTASYAYSLGWRTTAVFVITGTALVASPDDSVLRLR